MALLAALAALVHAPAAFAECTAAETRLDGPGSPFDGAGNTLSHGVIPHYDQDGLGICYAIAASQLIDYHRIKVGGEEVTLSNVTSPIDLALMSRRTTLDSRRPIGEGGTPGEVIRRLREHSSGFCPAAIVAGALKSSKWEGEDGFITMASDERYLALLEDVFLGFRDLERPLQPLYTAYADLAAAPPPDTTAGSWRALAEAQHMMNLRSAIASATGRCSSDHRFFMGPGSWDPTSFFRYYLDWEENRSVAFFRNIINPSCDGHRVAYRPPEPVVVDYDVARSRVSRSSDVPGEFFKEIDRALCPGAGAVPEPAAIGFCSSVLRPNPPGPDRGGPGYRFFHHDGDRDDDCGEHASVVVGRRVRDGKVEYLIRNSWGVECEGHYHADIEAACEDGSLWVSADDLKWNIYRVTRF